MGGHLVVLTTAGSADEARKIADALPPVHFTGY